MPVASYPKAIGGVCQSTIDSQHVDAGQLNVLPQQQPITLSFTKVTLD